jgi:hypothetical protein
MVETIAVRNLAMSNGPHVPVCTLGNLAKRLVYLPAVRWEVELGKWLAHAAYAAAHGNDKLKQHCLARCADLLQNAPNGALAHFKRMC